MHRSAMHSLAAGAAMAALMANTDHGHAASGGFAGDTVLYSAEAPEGRVFPAGALHPGDAWHDHPSHVTAHARDAQAGATGAAHLGAELELANAKADQLQATLDEQKAKFDQSWQRLTGEKDAAEAENKDLRGQIASLQEDVRQAQAKATELAEQLAMFGEENKALEAKVAEQAEALAKFDGDGDGKPGGSAPKGDKASK